MQLQQVFEKNINKTYFWQTKSVIYNYISLLKYFICYSAVNGGNVGVKNKMLNNGLILTGKIYVVHKATYKKSRWLDKNEEPREV